MDVEGLASTEGNVRSGELGNNEAAIRSGGTVCCWDVAR